MSIYKIEANKREMMSDCGQYDLLADTNHRSKDEYIEEFLANSSYPEALKQIWFDLNRSYFFSTNGKSWLDFVRSWTSDLNYTAFGQGDVEGRVHFLLQTNMINNPTFSKYLEAFMKLGGEQSISFGYLDDDNIPCSLSIIYTNCELSLWAITIVRDSTSEAEKKKVFLFTPKQLRYKSGKSSPLPGENQRVSSIVPIQMNENLVAALNSKELSMFLNIINPDETINQETLIINLDYTINLETLKKVGHSLETIPLDNLKKIIKLDGSIDFEALKRIIYFDESINTDALNLDILKNIINPNNLISLDILKNIINIDNTINFDLLRNITNPDETTKILRKVINLNDKVISLNALQKSISLDNKKPLHASMVEEFKIRKTAFDAIHTEFTNTKKKTKTIYETNECFKNYLIEKYKTLQSIQDNYDKHLDNLIVFSNNYLPQKSITYTEDSSINAIYGELFSELFNEQTTLLEEKIKISYFYSNEEGLNAWFESFKKHYALNWNKLSREDFDKAFKKYLNDKINTVDLLLKDYLRLEKNQLNDDSYIDKSLNYFLKHGLLELSVTLAQRSLQEPQTSLYQPITKLSDLILAKQNNQIKKEDFSNQLFLLASQFNEISKSLPKDLKDTLKDIALNLKRFTSFKDNRFLKPKAKKEARDLSLLEEVNEDNSELGDWGCSAEPLSREESSYESEKMLSEEEVDIRTTSKDVAIQKDFVIQSEANVPLLQYGMTPLEVDNEHYTINKASTTASESTNPTISPDEQLVNLSERIKAFNRSLDNSVPDYLKDDIKAAADRLLDPRTPGRESYLEMDFKDLLKELGKHTVLPLRLEKISGTQLDKEFQKNNIKIDNSLFALLKRNKAEALVLVLALITFVIGLALFFTGIFAALGITLSSVAATTVGLLDVGKFLYDERELQMQSRDEVANLEEDFNTNLKEINERYDNILSNYNRKVDSYIEADETTIALVSNHTNESQGRFFKSVDNKDADVSYFSDLNITYH